MATELKDKVAVVTGGSRGIGRAIADRLAAEGAKVVVCARNPKRLKETVQQLTQRHPNSLSGLAVDVRRYEDCRQLMKHAAETFGGIDILVNNAGVRLFKPVDQITPEEWDELVAINLSGVFYCVREVRALDAQARRRIYLQHFKPCRGEPLQGRGGLQCLQVRAERFQRSHHAGPALRRDPCQLHHAWKCRYGLRRPARLEAALELEAHERGHRQGGSRSGRLSRHVSCKPHRAAPLAASEKIGRRGLPTPGGLGEDGLPAVSCLFQRLMNEHIVPVNLSDLPAALLF